MTPQPWRKLSRCRLLAIAVQASASGCGCGADEHSTAQRHSIKVGREASKRGSEKEREKEGRAPRRNEGQICHHSQMARVLATNADGLSRY